METKHIILKNNGVFCMNCGQHQAFNFPISIKEFTDTSNDFSTKHSNCKKTYKEPEIPIGEDSYYGRIKWWLEFGEVGLSSKTIYNHMMRNRVFDINHPYDIGDFKRCYALLTIVPEWKSRLEELKGLSPVWCRLIEEWPTLNTMFKDTVRSNWNIEKAKKMNLFMQSIIRDGK